MPRDMTRVRDAIHKPVRRLDDKLSVNQNRKLIISQSEIEIQLRFGKFSNIMIRILSNIFTEQRVDDFELRRY